MSGVPILGSLVGGKKTTVIKQAPPPTPSNPDNADALAAAAEAERKARGRASNILTSGQGILGSPTLRPNVLLGSGTRLL